MSPNRRLHVLCAIGDRHLSSFLVPKGPTLPRRSTSLNFAHRNQHSSPAFSSHENSRRKLQHGPAGRGHVFQPGHRRRRYAAGVRRQQARPVRRSDDRRCRASALTRQANHLRQRPAAGTRGRRAICPEHKSPRTLRPRHEPRNPAPCARCQPRTVTVLSPRAQKRGSYPQLPSPLA